MMTFAPFLLLYYFFHITSVLLVLSTSKDLLFLRSGASSDSGSHIGNAMSLSPFSE